MTILHGAFKNRTMIMFIKETDPDYPEWRTAMSAAHMELRPVTLDEVQAAYSAAMEVIITHQFGDLLDPEKAH